MAYVPILCVPSFDILVSSFQGVVEVLLKSVLFLWLLKAYMHWNFAQCFKTWSQLYLQSLATQFLPTSPNQAGSNVYQDGQTDHISPTVHARDTLRIKDT